MSESKIPDDLPTYHQIANLLSRAVLVNCEIYPMRIPIKWGYYDELTGKMEFGARNGQLVMEGNTPEDCKLILLSPVVMCRVDFYGRVYRAPSDPKRWWFPEDGPPAPFAKMYAS